MSSIVIKESTSKTPKIPEATYTGWFFEGVKDVLNSMWDPTEISNADARVAANTDNFKDITVVDMSSKEEDFEDCVKSFVQFAIPLDGMSVAQQLLSKTGYQNLMRTMDVIQESHPLLAADLLIEACHSAKDESDFNSLATVIIETNHLDLSSWMTFYSKVKNKNRIRDAIDTVLNPALDPLSHTSRYDRNILRVCANDAYVMNSDC